MENGERKVFDIDVVLFLFVVVARATHCHPLPCGVQLLRFSLCLLNALCTHIDFIYRKRKKGTSNPERESERKKHGHRVRVCLFMFVESMRFVWFFVRWYGCPFHSRCLFHLFGIKFLSLAWPTVYLLTALTERFPFGQANSKGAHTLHHNPTGRNIFSNIYQT